MPTTNSGMQTVVEVPSLQFSADSYTVDPAAPSIEVAAADPRRRSVVVQNDPDSAGVIFVTTGKGQSIGGFRLVAGAGYEFKTAAPINARAVGAVCTVNVVTESGWSC